jgi:hypothetical protein
MDIFDLLEEVQKRPSMYLGSNAQGEQLRNLELLVSGYTLALQRHGIRERVADFSRDFAKYLHDRFDWGVSCGPVAAVRDASKNEEETWSTFWKLVQEFRTSLTSR